MKKSTLEKYVILQHKNGEFWGMTTKELFKEPKYESCFRDPSNSGRRTMVVTEFESPSLEQAVSFYTTFMKSYESWQ